MLIKTTRNKIPFFVAAAGSSAAEKRLSNYVCTGHGGDDEMKIQQAINDCHNYIGSGQYEAKGRVTLSTGTFYLHPTAEAAGARLSGTGATLTAGASLCVLDIADQAKHDALHVGDMIFLRGGTNGTKTLEESNRDGWHYIRVVTPASTLVSVVMSTYGTFTNVSWERATYALRLPPTVELHGQGAGKTQLAWDYTPNAPTIPAAILLCKVDTYATGINVLQDLSITGANMPAGQTNWWECNGVMSGGAFDVKIIDCEIRYFAQGFGLCVGEGWGFEMKGGWIEDCRTSAFLNGCPYFTKTKIQQSTDHNIIIEEGLDPNYSAQFTACEIQSPTTPTAGKAAMVIRGRTSGLHFSGRVTTYGTTDYGFLFTSVCALGGVQRVDIDAYWKNVDGGVFIYTAGNECYVNYLRVRGIFTNAGTILKETSFPYYFVSGDVDMQGPGYDFTKRYRTKNYINATGGYSAQGIAYVAKPGTLGEFQLPTMANDPQFLGIANRVCGNGSANSLVVEGGCLAYVDATAAIVIGDLLTLYSTTPGRLKKAASGDTCIARSLQARASGSGLNQVEIIPPIKYP